jgi:hypothetical protein
VANFYSNLERPLARCRGVGSLSGEVLLYADDTLIARFVFDLQYLLGIIEAGKNGNFAKNHLKYVQLAYSYSRLTRQ